MAALLKHSPSAENNTSPVAPRYPLYLSLVQAGFPSPADEYLDKSLSLDELLVKNKAATFFVRVTGDSMKDAGILSGDTLIVDRSLEARNGSVVVAVVDGETTVKRLVYLNGRVFLQPENSKYKAIEILDSMSFEVWGVVIHAIHSLR